MANIGYIWKKYGIYLEKIWDIFEKNHGIFWAETIRYFMVYIWQKLMDILGKNYGIYYGIYFLKLLVIFGNTIGLTGPLDILR